MYNLVGDCKNLPTPEGPGKCQSFPLVPAAVGVVLFLPPLFSAVRRCCRLTLVARPSRHAPGRTPFPLQSFFTLRRWGGPLLCVVGTLLEA